MSRGSLAQIGSGTPHVGLSGGTGSALRFRPERVNASDLGDAVSCEYTFEGQRVGPVSVLDLSPAGIGIGGLPSPLPSPGSELTDLQIRIDGQAVWSGEAVVMHVVDSPPARLGARFTSGLLDLRQLRTTHTLATRGLERGLKQLQSQRERLPASWRAAVGDMRLRLEHLKDQLDQLERTVERDPLRRAEQERALFETLLRRWGTSFYAECANLSAASKALPPAAMEDARTYATTQLLEAVMPCPIHRRAFEKPRGYAGDYQLMRLYFAEEHSGEGLYGRFLHYVAQNYTLGRTVVQREVQMRQAALRALNTPGEGPVRILSVACGPALEMQRLLSEVEALNRPVELLMLDQDEEALQTCHEELSRRLLDGHRGRLPVTLSCLHYSVKQILKPADEAERRIQRDVLSGCDLIYSAGLFDYLPDPVASRLVQRLYSFLRSGGRLYVGNLKEAPDTFFTMEFIVGWHLLYRAPDDMIRIGQGLPPEAKISVDEDATGHCMFLDVQKA